MSDLKLPVKVAHMRYSDFEGLIARGPKLSKEEGIALAREKVKAGENVNLIIKVPVTALSREFYEAHKKDLKELTAQVTYVATSKQAFFETKGSFSLLKAICLADDIPEYIEDFPVEWIIVYE